MPYASKPDAALDAALAHHEAGRLDEAAAGYAAILATQPVHAEALHLRGVLAHQRGRHDEALPDLQHAVALSPERALFLGNLGSVLLALGRAKEAVAAYREALAREPAQANTCFNLGVAHEALGEAEQALACFEQTNALAPDHIPARMNAAIVLKKLGRTDEARAAFAAVLARDPGNALADHQLAILTGSDRPRAPDAYLIHTFDAAAANFDAHLQGDLHYDTPEQLAALVAASAAGQDKPWSILDIGCGTGLSGTAIAEIAPPGSCLTGVDLSPKMLEKARQGGRYQRLHQAEILEMMREEPAQSLDLLFSTDVFIYHGALEAIFAETARLLRPGGIFAFSAEALAPGAADYRLLPSGRYAHSEAYLLRLAQECRFRISEQRLASARLEAGVPVPAWLMVLRAG